jgi:carboxymethylenebutenolidase
MNQIIVSLTRADGSTMRAMYCLPDSIAAPVPAVLVIFDFFGMTADLSRIAARFVDNGYAALVPDLYDRKERRFLCVLRAVRAAVSGSGREYDDLRLAREYLGTQKEVDSTRVAVTGFCMGGGFAVYLGTTGLYKVSAPFYGGVPQDKEKLRGTCPVIASCGARDSKARLADAHRLQSHLTQLGVPHELKFYPDAGHSFMNRNTGFLAEKVMPHLSMHAEYHEASAENLGDGYSRSLIFI